MSTQSWVVDRAAKSRRATNDSVLLIDNVIPFFRLDPWAEYRQSCRSSGGGCKCLNFSLRQYPLLLADHDLPGQLGTHSKTCRILTKVNIEDSTFNPWIIIELSKDGAAANLPWAMQVTAPLSLEAIHDLAGKAIANEDSPLLATIIPARAMVYVTKEFFQANPNSTSDSVKADVLTFFSLVISYAKGALIKISSSSPNTIVSMIPRTDWTNLFYQIKPAVPGSLYELVKILACYRFVDGDDE